MRERKQSRLKGFDYATQGAYFVTMCVKNMESLLGDIQNGTMHLNSYGQIVHDQWLWLLQRYDYLSPDVFVVMPNHLHAILHIAGNGRDKNNNVGPGRDRSLHKIKPVPELIGAFKTTSSKLIRKSGLQEFQWQKSYYDHIVRNEHELDSIRHYIMYNPSKWDVDIENPCRERSRLLPTDYYANILKNDG